MLLSADRRADFSDEWERLKQRAAMYVAYHLVPDRVRLWVIVFRQNEVRRDDQTIFTVRAVDLTTGLAGSGRPVHRPLSDRMAVGE